MPRCSGTSKRSWRRTTDEERCSKKLCRAPQQFAFSPTITTPPSSGIDDDFYVGRGTISSVCCCSVGGDLMEIESTIGTMQEEVEEEEDTAQIS